MQNKKMTAGIIALLGIGVTLGLLAFSKKNNRTGGVLFKKTKDLTTGLKGKFGEFVDQLAVKMQGVLK